jgi:hypothetical protein
MRRLRQLAGVSKLNFTRSSDETLVLRDRVVATAVTTSLPYGVLTIAQRTVSTVCA